mgnify:CR=1 FL=1
MRRIRLATRRVLVAEKDPIERMAGHEPASDGRPDVDDGSLPLRATEEPAAPNVVAESDREEPARDRGDVIAPAASVEAAIESALAHVDAHPVASTAHAAEHVASASPPAKASVGPAIDTSCSRGISGGPSEMTSDRTPVASSRPAPPPKAASSCCERVGNLNSRFTLGRLITHLRSVPGS